MPSLADIGYPPAGTTPFKGGETAALARMAGEQQARRRAFGLGCGRLPLRLFPPGAACSPGLGGLSCMPYAKASLSELLSLHPCYLAPQSSQLSAWLPHHPLRPS